MKSPRAKVSIVAIVASVTSGLGGQVAAHTWLGMASDNFLGFAVGVCAAIAVTTIAHDEGFDTGYQAGKRDGAPGLFDSFDRHS